MRFTKILIGLFLLYGAWHLHTKAVAMTCNAVDAPRTVDDTRPPVRAGEFFGKDPREVAKTPKARSELANARRVEQMAMLAALGGVALVISTVMSHIKESKPRQPLEVV
jgi:hypothetical protein